MIDPPVRQETFYAVQRQFTRDVIDVFVIRYTWQGSAIINTEHLRVNGWTEHNEFEVMEPVLSIPGILAHMLVNTEPYDPGPAEDVVENLIARALGRPRDRIRPVDA